jgi:ferrochelatase
MPKFSSPTHKPDTPPTTGVLLVNLGTPQAPTAKALRPYLRQFLSDQRVIEYPRWLWWLILNGIVLIVRPRKSAKLYQAIWTKDGSPLLAITQSLAAKLQASFGDDLKIVVAMRYGNPSIQAGLEKLRAANAQRILIVPLFPQYTAATTATIFDVVFDELKKWRWVPELRTINSYHDHPLYIKGMADSIRDFWEGNGRSQKLLYSFHGIPQNYADKGDPYPQFCHQTAQMISAELGLNEDETQICFQSRFGPEEWLQPYTDETLIDWGENGPASVDTICPGFAVDCLETVEEMGAENKQYFLESGGETYQYIPCLNDSEAQVSLFAALIKQHTRDWAMVDPDPTSPDAKATGY